MFSTRYTILFILAITSVVALVLAGMSIGLKDTIAENEAVYNKKAILSSISSEIEGDFSELTDTDIADIFQSQVEQVVTDTDGNVLSKEDIINAGYVGGMAEFVDVAKEHKKADEDKLLPVYVFTADSGKKYYIVYTRGKGLWDYIWGYIALKDDAKTVAGVAFDHKGETAGLGAEIKDNASFGKQFAGKTLCIDPSHNHTLQVKKGGISRSEHGQLHEVDGISGATITCDGVTEMLYRGIHYYDGYFKTIRG